MNLVLIRLGDPHRAETVMEAWNLAMEPGKEKYGSTKHGRRKVLKKKM